MARVRDLVGALRDIGVRIHREDQLEVYGWCPLHEKIKGKEDTKPSWSINKATGMHHCFSCGYGGTLRGLAMDLQFPADAFAAGKWIHRWGIVLLDADEMPAYFGDRDPDFESDEPLEDEVITESSLARFFAPPDGPLEERSISLEAAEFYEVLWDVIEFGWILPIRDPKDVLLGWQFKSKRVFLNYPEHISKGHCVFGLTQLDPGQRAIIVESPLDCARMKTAGIEGAVSTMGTGVTDAQMRAILEKTDSIMLALDNDEAGRAATRTLVRGETKYGKVIRKPWAPRFRSCTVFNYDGVPEKDPGDMADEDIVVGAETAVPWLQANLRPIDRTPTISSKSYGRKPGVRR